MCGLLGAGTLLPFNVLITENAYYLLRFHAQPTWAAAADAFEPLLTTSFNAPYVAAGLMYLSLRLEHRLSISLQVPLHNSTVPQRREQPWFPGSAMRESVPHTPLTRVARCAFR